MIETSNRILDPYLRLQHVEGALKRCQGCSSYSYPDAFRSLRHSSWSQLDSAPRSPHPSVRHPTSECEMRADRRTQVSLALLFTALTALSCRRTPPVPQELRVVFASEVLSLDPNEKFETVTDSYAINVFEPLLRFDWEATYVPVLATRWQISDGRTWQFFIRPGVSLRSRWIASVRERRRFLDQEDSREPEFRTPALLEEYRDRLSQRASHRGRRLPPACRDSAPHSRSCTSFPKSPSSRKDPTSFSRSRLEPALTRSIPGRREHPSGLRRIRVTGDRRFTFFGPNSGSCPTTAKGGRLPWSTSRPSLSDRILEAGPSEKGSPTISSLHSQAWPFSL